MIIQGLAINGMTVSSSAATISTDTYFNLVTLLLPGTGTNGAQNNTFLDSSTNNFTVTRNGNTTQGTFSPFSQTGWSNYFDGSDSLTVPTGTFSYTAGVAFTFECFVYRVSTTGSSSLAQLVVGTAVGGTSLSVYITNTGEIKYGQANVADILSSAAGIIKLNQWHHIAIGKNSSNQVRMWVDGNSVATGTDNTNYATGSMYIGRNVANTQNLDGYISNLRSVTGSDVYGYGNSSITVPTTPLTAITNTQLLTCQSNRFVDNSSNAFAITVAGNTSVQAFAPFAPTTAYSAAAVGGSGYFDGNGDYLSLSTGSTLNTTGDFTIEAFAYVTSASTFAGIFSMRNSTNSDGASINILNTGFLDFNVDGTGGGSYTGTAVPLNQWFHVALVRSGSSANNCSCYLNGVRVGQFTSTAQFNGSSGTAVIGRYYTDGANQYWITGFISNLRVVIGSALYSGTTYTVPTAPLTAISNTSLLLNYTNGGITDATAKNVLETVGNAQISTAQSKFGGSSMYFDGSGDWLFTKTSPNLDMGTGDVTIEGWFYLTATVDFDYRMIVSDATNGNNYICIRAGGTGGQVEVNINGASFRLNLNNSVSINTWFHLAVSRSSGTWYGFVNGNSIGTSSGTGAFNLGNGGMYVGRWGGVLAHEWPGYIDDLRITTGLARYTTTFTPPTQAFPTQ